jgi:hypothetical protein
MTTDEAQREQQERRETIVNDLKVRGTTFHAFAQAEAEEPRGRFSGVNPPHVVGTALITKYPEQPENSPFHIDPVPSEPPLGYSIDNPSAAPLVEATPPSPASPDDPSCPSGVERRDAGPSSNEVE